MNPLLDDFLIRAETVMNHPVDEVLAQPALERQNVHVGVDLGTAYTVLAVLDEQRQPLAGEYRFAQVVRDGLVVDFHGAIELLSELKRNVQARLGFELTTTATTHPPGVPLAEVRATRHVVEAAGFECRRIVDEPTAANAVLQVADGAVVDIGVAQPVSLFCRVARSSTPPMKPPAGHTSRWSLPGPWI